MKDMINFFILFINTFSKEKKKFKWKLCYHVKKQRIRAKIVTIPLSCKCIKNLNWVLQCIIFLVYGEIHRNKEEESGLSYWCLDLLMPCKWSKHQRFLDYSEFYLFHAELLFLDIYFNFTWIRNHIPLSLRV